MLNHQHILLTIGIAACGKSTFCRSMSDYYSLISRDKVRELLFGYDPDNIHEHYDLYSTNIDKFNRREFRVTKFIEDYIYNELSMNKNVLVDNTHLKISYLNQYNTYHVPIYHKIFDCNLEECIERDSKRIRKVGENIIRNQYEQYTSLLKSNYIFNDITQNKAQAVG